MIGSPEQGQVLTCLVVRRKTPNRIIGIDPIPKWDGNYQWLICNGMSMGRWTLHFGAPNIADEFDNREFAKIIHADTPGSELLEVKIHCTLSPVVKEEK